MKSYEEQRGIDCQNHFVKEMKGSKRELDEIGYLNKDFYAGYDAGHARALKAVEGLVMALKKAKVKFQIIGNPLEYMDLEVHKSANISDLESDKANEGIQLINEALEQFQREVNNGQI